MDIRSIIAKAGLLLIFLTTVISIALARSSSAQSPEEGAAQLKVGIADLDIHPRVGIPLAGYGAKERRLPEFMDLKNRYPDAFFFRPSEGRIDPIRSKVMILEKGEQRLVFISLDMIGVTSEFVDDLSRRIEHLGIKNEDLFISGTHTHSGPGTVTTRLPLEIVAVDLFIRKNYEYIVEKTVESVYLALGRMEAATLHSTHFEAHDLQVNKFRDDNRFDPNANLLLAKSLKTGNWLGGIVNFAIHGGALGPDNLKYSADVPGAIERSLETRLQQSNTSGSQRPSMLFVNGAEADVGPARKEVAGMTWIGEQFTTQAWPAIERAHPVEPVLSHRKENLWVGVPSFPIKDCHVGGFVNKVLPRGTKIPIPGFMPSHSSLTLAQVGDITLVTYPGEASTHLGYALKAMGKAMGHEDVWILGLTNDYLAYFTDKIEYFEAHYDSCSSLYNWRGARRIQSHYQQMMSRAPAVPTLN